MTTYLLNVAQISTKRLLTIWLSITGNVYVFRVISFGSVIFVQLSFGTQDHTTITCQITGHLLWDKSTGSIKHHMRISNRNNYNMSLVISRWSVKTIIGGYM